MELLIFGIASLVVSPLTFFTGFGLSTIMMPVFAIFCTAIALGAGLI